MNALVLQGADREAIFVPGTRLSLGPAEGAMSYALGCSGVGAQPSLDYEDTGETSEVIVSEGKDEGTVIVSFSSTYSDQYGQMQTMQGQVQVTVP
jgi:hypothetical protein